MGNRNSKNSEEGRSREFDVYVCRNGTVFSKYYNEWLEFVDKDDQKRRITRGKEIDSDDPPSSTQTFRIYAGRVNEKMVPQDVDPNSILNDVTDHVEASFAFSCLKRMNLRSRYEVYLCRKVSQDQNYHIWLEIVNTRRPYNDVVHKFHLRVHRDEEEKYTQDCVESERMKKKEMEGQRCFKHEGKSEYIYKDEHKQLFPPGEGESCKVAVGYIDLSINEVLHLSSTIVEELSGEKKNSDLLKSNCRTYVHRLLQYLSLPGEKAMDQLSVTWGTGLGEKEVRKGIRVGKKSGMLIGCGMCLAGVGICCTVVIGTLGILNPAKVGEVVGIGMVVTGGVMIVGGVSSAVVGGVAGGVMGSLAGGAKANLRDGGFLENAVGENVILVKRSEEEERKKIDGD